MADRLLILQGNGSDSTLVCVFAALTMKNGRRTEIPLPQTIFDGFLHAAVRALNSYITKNLDRPSRMAEGEGYGTEKNTSCDFRHGRRNRR